MIHEPEVSVVLPSYNRLAHLRSAVESVLAQRFTDFELLIADDGSDADTRAWLAGLHDPRVRVFALLHSGNPSAVRNHALRAARGHYVAFLDSDDVWLPDKLGHQFAVLQSQPLCRWNYHASGRIDAAGNPATWSGVKPWQAFDGDIVEALLEVHALIATPTVMAERTLLLEAGGFDEGQCFAEDYDLWLRLAMRSPVSTLAETLALVRVHSDNYSQDRLGAHLGWARLYEKMRGLLEPPRLRRVCRRQRARSLLYVAALQRNRGQRRAAAGSLLAAIRDGWRFARWWSEVGRLAGGRLRARG